MVAPGKNHLKQKRSVSLPLFLTQNLFVAFGIDLFALSIECSESYPEYNVKAFEDFKSAAGQ